MIEAITRYRAKCDVPGCGSSTLEYLNWGLVRTKVLEQGWENREIEDPNGPEELFPIEIFRCFKCKKADKKPLKWDEGWTPEVASGAQG